MNRLSSRQPAGATMVRCASHRAREKLQRLDPAWGKALPGFYSWQTACTGGFFAVPDGLLPQALAITGVTKALARFEYFPCR